MIVDNGQWTIDNENLYDMNKNIIKEKSYAFAVKIVIACTDLTTIKKEFVLSRQLLRSGTAIGALVREAEQAESKADFIHKLSIALKEANETEYWLALMQDTKLISSSIFDELNTMVIELLRLLTSIIKSSKANR